MSALANNALIQYGGYRFNETTNTTSLSVVPQYDGAGRTVIHNVYNLTIETYLTGRAIDAAVRNVVRQLTKPAYTFVYSGTGLGVGVNIGGIRDVVWGPKPGKVDVKPLGGGNAVKLTWSVSFCIPDCNDASYRFRLMEYNFGLSYSIDRAGYTTRRYSGYIRIPQTRGRAATDLRLSDSVDNYREEINPVIPPGFRRIPGEFTIDHSKCRLDFSITDEQMGLYTPPQGIVEAEASHRISCPPGKFRTWQCALSASYEVGMNSGATIATARDAFFALLKDRVGSTLDAIRLGQIRQGFGGGGIAGSNGGGRLETTANKGAVIPESFAIEEPEVLGRPKVRFTCTYRVVGPSLHDMLQISGQFRPVPGSDWRLWTLSMANTLGPRGHAGLAFRREEDAIVDLCVPEVTVDLSNTPRNIRYNTGLIPPGVFPEPTPDASWLGWENEVRLEADNGTIPWSTLPIPPSGGGSPGPSGAILGGLLGDGPVDDFPKLPNVPPPAGMPWKLPTDDIFFDPIKPPGPNGGGTQQRKQACFIYFTGRAARVAYGIAPPQLIKWGKAKVVPANRKEKGEGFWAGAIGDVGWPVYGARWNLRWWCSEVPPGYDLPVTQPPLSNTGPT